MRIHFQHLGHANRCLKDCEEALLATLVEGHTNQPFPALRIQNAMCQGLGYSSYHELKDVFKAQPGPRPASSTYEKLLGGLEKGFGLSLQVLDDLGFYPGDDNNRSHAHALAAGVVEKLKGTEPVPSDEESLLRKLQVLLQDAPESLRQSLLSPTSVHQLFTFKCPIVADLLKLLLGDRRQQDAFLLATAKLEGSEYSMWAAGKFLSSHKFSSHDVEYWIDNGGAVVLRAFASSAKTPPATLRRIYQRIESAGLSPHAKFELRRDLAVHRNTPLDLQLELADCDGMHVRWTMVGRKAKLAPELVAKLLLDRNDIVICDLIANRAECTLEQVKRFVRAPLATTRGALLRRKELPPEVRKPLLKDEEVFVRWWFARRHDLTDYEQAQLATDTEVGVLGALGLNGSVSEQTLLAVLSKAEFGLVVAIADRPEVLPMAVIESLSHHPEALVRRLIARRRETSATILRRLAQDEVRQVRTEAEKPRMAKPRPRFPVLKDLYDAWETGSLKWRMKRAALPQI